MKKTLLSLFAVLSIALFALPAKAQKVNIYATYGGYTQMDATDMHDDWGGVKTAWGAVNLGVDFKLGSRLRLGPSYSISSTSTKGKYSSDIYYHVVMLNAKYDYFRSGIFTLYAHLGLGAEISHLCPKGGDSYNKGYFAYQASPLGMRAGLGNNFNFMAELGFGAQGLVQLGFSYDF